MPEETVQKQWWISAIEKLGVPTVYLVILTIACWRIGVYVSTEIVSPIVDAHIKALDAHIAVANALAATIDEARENGRESLLKIEKTTEETLKILKDKQ